MFISTPIYGDGEEAGNEAGYVVGMSTCYPEPGAAKVRDGEALTTWCPTTPASGGARG